MDDDLEKRRKEIELWAEENIKEYPKQDHDPSELLSSFSLRDKFEEYDLPVHDQGDKNNCTSHAFASVMEYELAKFFKERVEIDVDDLWDNQLKFGSATEEGDDFIGVAFIAEKYGLKFKTKSGKTGIFKPKQGIKMDKENKKEMSRAGAAKIKSENVKDETVSAISKSEYKYSMTSLYLSFFIIVLGVIVSFLGLFGVVDFEIEILEMKSKLTNASPGVFIVLVGLIFSYINRPKIDVK